jgi:hypothetical protein
VLVLAGVLVAIGWLCIAHGTEWRDMSTAPGEMPMVYESMTPMGVVGMVLASAGVLTMCGVIVIWGLPIARRKLLSSP